MIISDESKMSARPRHTHTNPSRDGLTLKKLFGGTMPAASFNEPYSTKLETIIFHENGAKKNGI